MKELLNRLFQHETLSRDEAKLIVQKIGEGSFNNSEIAAFLTVFGMRSITVDELSGFRDAMLELCVKIDLEEFDAIDIVGTGGDGKDTFNISTSSCFVVAGAGHKVAKHGNYGVSSSCGSSNVLEYLGVKFSNQPDDLKRALADAGFCMMHAPLFHPAMKYVAPTRKEMAVRTFFNMLGPMINPSFPKKQFLGVFNLELARLYGYLYQQTDVTYSITHALDGYDEISLTGTVKVIDNGGEKMLKPSDFGFEMLNPEELASGSTVESSAEILLSILENRSTEAQKNVVLANAGMAIRCARNNEISPLEGIALAKESLESGRAFGVLKKLI